MLSRKWTVAYQVGDTIHKICKVMFGRDGSYYVTVPYHPERRALVFKQLVNYAAGDDQAIGIDDAVDVGVVEDDEARLKLSHHLDGFLQFSGSGILSGRNALTGAPRGIATFSWPLSRPVSGPSFGVSIKNPERFETVEDIDGMTIVFSIDDLDPGPQDNGLVIEGYYFAPAARRFLSRDWQGRRVLRLAHPSRAILELPACVTAPGCEWPGFIGLEMRSTYVDLPVESGFVLSSATGEARRNDKGELTGYGLYALFPPPVAKAIHRARRLEYRPQEPPYSI